LAQTYHPNNRKVKSFKLITVCPQPPEQPNINENGTRKLISNKKL